MSIEGIVSSDLFEEGIQLEIEKSQIFAAKTIRTSEHHLEMN